MQSSGIEIVLGQQCANVLFSNRRVSARAVHRGSLNGAYQCFAAKTGGRVSQESVLDSVLLSIFTSRKETNLN